MLREPASEGNVEALRRLQNKGMFAAFAKAAESGVQADVRSLYAMLTWVVLAIVFASFGASAQQARTEASRNSGAESSSLNIVAANVQMLLIGPDGKETGYDPATKKRVRAIPGSVYYEDALLAYDSGRTDPNTTQTVNVNHPAAGRYRLIVSCGTAAEGEEYEIRVTLHPPDGSDVQTARIAGTAERGKPATYELSLSIDPAGVAIVNSKLLRPQAPRN